MSFTHGLDPTTLLSRRDRPLVHTRIQMYIRILYGIKFKFHGWIGFVKNQFWICNSNLLEWERKTHTHTYTVHPCRNDDYDCDDGSGAVDGLIIVLLAVSLVFRSPSVRSDWSHPYRLFKVGLIFNFRHPQVIKVPDNVGHPLHIGLEREKSISSALRWRMHARSLLSQQAFQRQRYSVTSLRT